MEIIHFDLHHPVQPTTPLVACIGYFDGLHVGHRQLISHVLAHAKAQNAKAALITFEPDPWTIIKQMDDLEHLTPMHKRIETVSYTHLICCIRLKTTGRLKKYN